MSAAFDSDFRLVPHPDSMEGIEFSLWRHQFLIGESPVYEQWWYSLPADERAGYQAEIAEAEEKEQAKEDESRRLGEENKLRSRVSNLEAAGVPLKDIDRIIAGTVTETAAVAAAREFVEQPAGILVLSGTRGCGKTTAAGWALAAITDAWVLDPDKEISKDLCSAFRDYADIHSSNGRFLDVSRLARVSRYKDEEMDPLEKCDILVIDDLGMEFADQKGSFLATLDGLVNARYAANRKTIITTNLPAAEFRNRYGERIADRIRENGRYLELKGQSLRGAK